MLIRIVKRLLVSLIVICALSIAHAQTDSIIATVSVGETLLGTPTDETRFQHTYLLDVPPGSTVTFIMADMAISQAFILFEGENDANIAQDVPTPAGLGFTHQFSNDAGPYEFTIVTTLNYRVTILEGDLQTIDLEAASSLPVIAPGMTVTIEADDTQFGTGTNATYAVDVEPDTPVTFDFGNANPGDIQVSFSGIGSANVSTLEYYEEGNSRLAFVHQFSEEDRPFEISIYSSSEEAHELQVIAGNAIVLEEGNLPPGVLVEGALTRGQFIRYDIQTERSDEAVVVEATYTDREGSPDVYMWRVGDFRYPPDSQDGTALLFNLRGTGPFQLELEGEGTFTIRWQKEGDTSPDMADADELRTIEANTRLFSNNDRLSNISRSLEILGYPETRWDDPSTRNMLVLRGILLVSESDDGLRTMGSRVAPLPLKTMVQNDIYGLPIEFRDAWRLANEVDFDSIVEGQRLPANANYGFDYENIANVYNEATATTTLRIPLGSGTMTLTDMAPEAITVRSPRYDPHTLELRPAQLPVERVAVEDDGSTLVVDVTGVVTNGSVVAVPPSAAVNADGIPVRDVFPINVGMTAAEYLLSKRLVAGPFTPVDTPTSNFIAYYESQADLLTDDMPYGDAVIDVTLPVEERGDFYVQQIENMFQPYVDDGLISQYALDYNLRFLRTTYGGLRGNEEPVIYSNALRAPGDAFDQRPVSDWFTPGDVEAAAGMVIANLLVIGELPTTDGGTDLVSEQHPVFDAFLGQYREPDGTYLNAWTGTHRDDFLLQLSQQNRTDHIAYTFNYPGLGELGAGGVYQVFTRDPFTGERSDQGFSSIFVLPEDRNYHTPYTLAAHMIEEYMLHGRNIVAEDQRAIAQLNEATRNATTFDEYANLAAAAGYPIPPELTDIARAAFERRNRAVLQSIAVIPPERAPNSYYEELITNYVSCIAWMRLVSLNPGILSNNTATRTFGYRSLMILNGLGGEQGEQLSLDAPDQFSLPEGYNVLPQNQTGFVLNSFRNSTDEFDPNFMGNIFGPIFPEGSPSDPAFFVWLMTFKSVNSYPLPAEGRLPLTSTTFPILLEDTSGNNYLANLPSGAFMPGYGELPVYNEAMAEWIEDNVSRSMITPDIAIDYARNMGLRLQNPDAAVDDYVTWLEPETLGFDISRDMAVAVTLALPPSE